LLIFEVSVILFYMSETVQEPEQQPLSIESIPPVAEETRCALQEIVSPYTPEEVRRWKEGAERFSGFYETLTHEQRQELVGFNALSRPIMPGNLQAVFLGEKPATLHSHSTVIRERLEATGLSTTDEYVYDPEQVLKIVELHANAFVDFPTQDVHALMKMMTEREKTDLPRESRMMTVAEAAPLMELMAKMNLQIPHEQRGLLLGFPRHAVNMYLELHAKRRASKETKGFRVYDVYWTDMDDTSESEEKARRLKSAFELSGMLSIMCLEEFHDPRLTKI
jgi:hypothetical protein